MSGQGIGQILVYAAVLIVLAYPLGLYMARVYNDEQFGMRGRLRFLGKIENAFLRLLRVDATREQDWKSYAKTVLIFSAVFSVPLFALLRLQGHLPLNPDHLPGVSLAHLAEHDRQLRHEHELAVLRRRVHDVVPHADGRARGAELRLRRRRDGRARRGRARLRPPLDQPISASSGATSTAALVYILLPLAIVLAIVLDLAGRRPDLPRPRDRDDRCRARTQTIARGPAASQVAIKQLGTNGGGFYNSNSAVPFENPTGLSNFLEVLAILLIPAAQVFMFGKMVGAVRQGWVLFAAMFAMFAIGVAIALPAEQHGSAVLRNSGVNITQGSGQTGGNMYDKEIRFGIANSVLWTVPTTTPRTAR